MSASRPPAHAPLHIAMIVPHIGTGGDWVAVKTISRALRQRGHWVSLISTANTGGTTLPVDLHVVVPLNRGLRGLVRSLMILRRIPEEIDVLHAHSPIALLLGYALRALRCPKAGLIYTLHWDTPDRCVRHFAKYLILGFAHRVHYFSRQIGPCILTAYGIGPERRTLIHPGLDPDEFPLPSPTERISIRRELGFGDGELVLLFAGRLNPEKNIGLLFDFLENETDFARQHRVRLALAGEGPLRRQLADRARDHGLSDLVRFLGYVSPVRKAYAAADLLLLPSTSMETFGLVVVEAALCGVPTLRSDLPGAEDQITEGVEGSIYPVGNPELFHAKLKSLIRSRHALPAMGLRARMKALDCFRIQRCASAMELLYRSVSDL